MGSPIGFAHSRGNLPPAATPANPAKPAPKNSRRLTCLIEDSSSPEMSPLRSLSRADLITFRTPGHQQRACWWSASRQVQAYLHGNRGPSALAQEQAVYPAMDSAVNPPLLATTCHSEHHGPENLLCLGRRSVALRCFTEARLIVRIVESKWWTRIL